MKATTGKRGILHLAAALALLVCALGPVGGKVQAAASRFFPETGKTVNEPFLAYWTGHGGLSQQGYPITDAYNEVNDADGKTYLTQYFERARFEYHPESSDPKFKVLLGLLGKEALTAKYSDTAPDPTKKIVPGNGSRTFSQTGKAVTGLFLSYWSTHGGLEQQGYPITDAYNEVNDADGQTYITQYFERARFEYHPESSDPKFKVLLGLVGREIYTGKAGSGGGGGGSTGGGASTPTASLPNTPPTAPTAITPPPPPPWAGMRIPTPLDTAFIMPFWPSTNPLDAQAVFVKDGKVWTLQLKTGTRTPEDKGIPVQNMFPGLAFTNLTSAVAWPAGNPNAGTLFLFNHPVYSIFNITANRVMGAAPANPLDPNGPLIPGPVLRVLDYFSMDYSNLILDGPRAAFILPRSSEPKSRVYLCESSGYCDVYDASTRELLEDQSHALQRIWPGLPFTGGADAVVPWPNGKLYFFKGDQYAVVDLATDKVDPGYPRSIN